MVLNRLGVDVHVPTQKATWGRSLLGIVLSKRVDRAFGELEALYSKKQSKDDRRKENDTSILHSKCSCKMQLPGGGWGMLSLGGGKRFREGSAPLLQHKSHHYERGFC